MTPSMPKISPAAKYSATEAAALLGVSRRTLHRWVSQGLLKPRLSRATKRPRYLGADLLRLWRSEF